ncbi:MAG: efflux RND transporter periplasmic adaptor subunit [Planctomycetota bacterium]
MDSNSNKDGRRRARGRLGLLVLCLGIAVVLITSVLVFRREDSGAAGVDRADQPLCEVQRGPLRISVTQSGTIKNRDQVVLKNEVEGRTTIISLVSEGSMVKPGDLVVELDSSQLQDDRLAQQIVVKNAEAAHVRAREILAVTRNQAESDIAQAELEARFAVEDDKKYQVGEYPQLRDEAASRIAIADEELKRAADKLQWSEKLAANDYISKTELEADKLALTRAEIDKKLAVGALELLEEYTKKRRVDELESDILQKNRALERVKLKAAADIVQAEKEHETRESELERQRAKLTKIEQQIEKCRVVSPIAAMVVYATSGQSNQRGGSSEPLAEGQEVRERQELVYLPTASSMTAELKLHESHLDKVRESMPVIVTLDAVPGRRFEGRIARIAPLPDAQSVWMNPDLKVYNSVVHLTGETQELRSGMSCRAEVLIDEYADALYVPVQAVMLVDGRHTVYVPTATDPAPINIEIGLDNNSVVRVLSGLVAGQKVLLAPPLERGAKNTNVPTAPFDNKNEPVRDAPSGASRPSGAAADAAPGADGAPRMRGSDGARPEGRQEGRTGGNERGRGNRSRGEREPRDGATPPTPSSGEARGAQERGTTTETPRRD